MANMINYGNGIYAIDSGYMGPGQDAIHMIVEGDHIAFVDTGVSASLTNVLDAMNALGLRTDAVAYIILTHVHLDHAGGAGTMMRHFPGAKLIVHPRGARHMADPSKLIAGATAVYGATHMREVYGEIAPVAAERIIEARDGDTIMLGDRPLVCLDTPGHALHHICIVDKATGGIFTGDAFGASFGVLDAGDEQFIYPTTAPSQFDPSAMRASIERILGLAPTAVYLTHYGRLRGVPKAGRDLLRRLDAFVDLASRERNSGMERLERIGGAMMGYLCKEAREYGCQLTGAALEEKLAPAVFLNTLGIIHWLDMDKKPANAHSRGN